jgi:hypothetical protein
MKFNENRPEHVLSLGKKKRCVKKTTKISIGRGACARECLGVVINDTTTRSTMIDTGAKEVNMYTKCVKICGRKVR